jgi:hypothetical protein
VPRSVEDPLVAQAFDARQHEGLAHAIEKLSPDEAAFFLHKLEHAIRKRKIQITGYLAAMGGWLIAMTLAIAYYGTHDGFVAWVFVVPFGLVGAILYAFGTWAERVARTPGPPRATLHRVEPAAPAEPAKPAAGPS